VAGEGATEKYFLYRDPSGWSGRPDLVLHSRDATDATGWAAITSTFQAERYRGKRVRFSALVRTDDVRGAAGLVIRVERVNESHADARGPFDAHDLHELHGSAWWMRYTVVLDVAADAGTLSIGCALLGAGGVSCAEPQFQEVGRETPLTHGTVPWVRAEPQLNLSL
jgi:hypothetical protein